jgi:UDP-galactopyranose mutase
MFDYLIVGAGLYGSVLARELTDAGKRVLVVEKRSHIGGNCYTETRDGQVMNIYGGHIFHTNSRRLWDYVNRFGEFRQYSHHVKATAGGTVYSFPPNLMTYQQLRTSDPNVIRERFFTGYTEKMWGRAYHEVPKSVTARIPIRDTWNDEYFSDEFQGLPVAGYTPLIERMLDGIEVSLGVDYLKERGSLDHYFRELIYTGPLDALYDYDLGRLEWRGLTFEHWRHEGEWYQGVATMNYPDRCVPFLREEEWKFFYPPAGRLPYSWVSRHTPGGEAAYPVNDDRNNKLASEYQARARAQGIITGGRLADYRYYDMHQAIGAALAQVAQLLGV